MNEVNQSTAAAPEGGSAARSNRSGNSWFEAMAETWGKALDRQADRVIDRTNQLGAGDDQPSVVAELSAEAFRMQYLANASHTSIVSAGNAIDSLARKQ